MAGRWFAAQDAETMAVAGSDIDCAKSSHHVALFREESFALSFGHEQSIDDNVCHIPLISCLASYIFIYSQRD